MRLLFLLVALCSFGGNALGQTGPDKNDSAKRRPNIVLIVTDDLGYADLGFQGCKDIPTPHIDALAAGGVRFTNAYVTGPICGPTRAGLLSGRYQQRHSYDENPGPNNGLNLAETTLAYALRGGGYKTSALGKWHLGGSPPYRPWKRGFDEFYGFYGAMHAYVPGEVESSARMVFERTRKNREADPREIKAQATAPARGPAGPGGGIPGASPGKLVRGTADKPNVQLEENQYLTEALASKAVAFVERNRENPFFLYLAFNASHSPLQPSQKYLDRFPNLQGKRKAYAATTSALDDAVGSVVSRLRELKLDEETIIFFINDNGGPIDDIAANNSPLGGAKFSLWEGGIKVPACIRWKGKIPAKGVIDTPVSSLDIFPTFLAAAGLAVPKEKQLDGLNLLPFVQGEKTAAPPPRTLFWRFNQYWAIRSGDWKLVLPEKGEKVQLFNLARDVGEQNDLSAQHPDLVRKLTDEWKAWDQKNLPAKIATESASVPAAPPGEKESITEEIKKWQADREKRLRGDNGWLTLVGRYPLKAGANTFGTGKDNDVLFPAALEGTGPKRLGTIDVDLLSKKVTLKLTEGVSMTSEGKPFSGERILGTSPEKRDWVSLGRMSMHVIERGGKYFLRLADNESKLRANFPGCEWYPPNETWKVKATFIPYPLVKNLSIVNVLEEISSQPSPGFVEFQLQGQTHRLDAIREGEGLFFVFHDQTAGDTTYPPGRFLDVPKQPGANETFILDFNKAYNPPCAFSEHTTCPLPPKQNHLKLRIEAGEKYRQPK